MRPTSTGDECEMNIQPPKAVRFYRAPPAEKITTEKPARSEETPHLAKRERDSRVHRKCLLLCQFSSRARLFSAAKRDASLENWHSKQLK